ncbi:helix-turn-helix domain-containing protein [Roseivivax sediminis]|uniref:Transcriptional regulator, AraC family n=1 Tax=Roseivivax sediminis TaxID=936889 RepID=A0A1I2DJ72_9RHOB|nr:helix-turn-helix domain-containing protein [Roseivivax sediminis]SFE80488.1 transcriptional regulator, AraC family [Roseivivax sediminis]
MDRGGGLWHYSNMQPDHAIPAWTLYGERGAFPDLLHAETIADRAARHDWVIAPHRHAGLAQVLLLSTGGVRIRADGAERAPPLPALVYIPPGVVHGFAFARGTEGRVITLPVRAFPEVFGPDSATAPRLRAWFHNVPEAEAAASVAAIAREHAGRAPYRDAALRGHALALAATLARAAPGAPAPDRSRAAQNLEAFDRLIARHLRSRWRIADYADALGLTPQQLSRITRARLGCSASQHLEAEVFREAQRLLAYTRMSVAEAGYRLGFDDPAYFSRAFRRHTGMTPSAYRASVDTI